MWNALVYDLDGTLVDSAGIVAKLLNALRLERQQAPLALDTIKPWLSIGGQAMIMATLETDAEEAETLLAHFRTRYLAEPTDPGSLYPEVLPTLARLRDRGLPLGLCTNKPRALTDKVLDETGLGQYFDVVCAGNDLATRKPHPDNLQACLTVLGSPPSATLVIGDSQIDQQLALACGAPFAFFSQGYDDGVALTPDVRVLHHHPDILETFKFS